MQKAERTLVFPAGSPCFDGHFPGSPVVPAVAILAELIAWSEEQLGRRVTGVTNARFQRPLLPDATWRITLEARAPGQVTVTAHEGDAIALRLRLTAETS
jgi:3-hydroxyacyl-[acyl-carrier-protein] dehydratase